MIEQVNGFITPMKEWNAVGKNDETTGAKIGTKSVFQSVLEDTVQNVYDTQKDVEQKQYLLATGQLEDHDKRTNDHLASILLSVIF